MKNVSFQNLPDDVMQRIVNKMDVEDVLKLSETSKSLYKCTKRSDKFQQVAFAIDFKKIDMKQQRGMTMITKVLTFLKHPLTWKSLINDKLTMLQVMKKSSRNYETFKIKNLDEAEMYDFEREKVFKVFKKLGKSVKVLFVKDSNFRSSAEFESLLSKFPRVQELLMCNVNISKVIEEKSLDLPELRDLSVKDCKPNIYGVFETFKHLNKITLHLDQVIAKGDMLAIERFIFFQEQLEILHLESSKKSFVFFHNMELAKYRLKELRMRRVAFDDLQLAFDFIFTQRNIEKLEVTLSSLTSEEVPESHLDEIVDFIFGDMKQLEDVTIICDYNNTNLESEFLVPNLKISALKFVMNKVNHKLLQAVLKMSPNVKRFYFEENYPTCFVNSPFAICKMPKLETLEIHGCCGCLKDFQIPGDQFKTVKFIPRCKLMMTIEENALAEFMRRHPSIQNAFLKILITSTLITKIETRNIFPNLVNLVVDNIVDTVREAIILKKIIPSLENIEVCTKSIGSLSDLDYEDVKKSAIRLSNVPISIIL